jgi:hypothetical protein
VRVPFLPVAAAFIALGHTLACQANEFTEAQALAVAKQAAAAYCSVETPCQFQAKREGSTWSILVSFTRRSSPGDPPLPYPGGHEIIVVDDGGKILATYLGE